MAVSTSAYPLRFQIGARSLFVIRPTLAHTALSLEDALAGLVPVLPRLADEADGHIITSLPAEQVPGIVAAWTGPRPFVRQRYVRYHCDLTISQGDWLAGLLAKTRSTLLRKVRRFAARAGGTIEVRACRAESEVAEFFAGARAVSRSSYQERLLGAGLPGDEATMRRLAAADRVRGFLLYLDGAPISYLYLTGEEDTLIFAHLGFDPAYRDLSPGTVLQFEAMRLLNDERHYRRLDFTEGEGQHKRLFATGGIECVDLLLMQPSFRNAIRIGGIAAFDGAVARTRRLFASRPLQPLARRLRR